MENWLTRTGLFVTYTLLTWWLGAIVAMVALNMLLDTVVMVVPFDLTWAKDLLVRPAETSSL